MRRHFPAEFPLHRLYLAVSLLLVMAVGSFTWASTTLAKYVTSGSVTDSARVAAFVVNTSGQANETLAIGAAEQSVSYTFTVSNTTGSTVCEVITAYDITVKFPSALSGISLTLKNGSQSFPGTTSDNTTYRFQSVGTFQPGVEEINNLELVFTRVSDDASADLSGITITVNAVQVD